MKRALISPQEVNKYGQRIAQIEEVGDDFEVCTPLYWMDCEDDVTVNHHYFDVKDNTIKLIPGTVIPNGETFSENDLLNQLLEKLK